MASHHLRLSYILVADSASQGEAPRTKVGLTLEPVHLAVKERTVFTVFALNRFDRSFLFVTSCGIVTHGVKKYK